MKNFMTDVCIVLECLHETYGMEGEQVLSGKNICRTMIYPIIKMLETNCVGISAKEIHKKLWEVYKKDSSKKQFLRKAEMIMRPYYQGGENVELTS